MNASDDAVRDDATQEQTRADSNEAAPLIREPISRRTAIKRLRILVGAVTLVAAAEACGGALFALYNAPNNTFGGPIELGRRAAFPPATPEACTLGGAGVFYIDQARCYLVHLSAQTPLLLSGSALAHMLAPESILRDGDGSYWLALYRACVHDGTTVRFFACGAFNCPNCGASYACDGEYLDGPAPRSLDRYPVSFNGEDVVVNTGTPNMSVDRPTPQNRILAIPDIIGCFHYVP